MSRPTIATIKDGDSAFALRVDACRVHLGGEYAGNIEVDLACPADTIDRILDCLRVQAPGQPPSEMALGNGPYAPGVQLVFWADWATRLQALPEALILVWGTEPVATVEPVLQGSVPLETRVAFIEPLEILSTLPVSSTDLVRLAANRERAWYLLAALLVTAGAAVGLALPGLELPHPLLGQATGGALVASGLAVGLGLARRPYRQVWLDRVRRRVLVIGGRGGSTKTKLASAPGRSLDDFDHVRLTMRWQLAQGVDDHDQELWRVTLEPPIPYAATDGSVHLHDEALLLGETRSEPAARKLAAEVAFHTGLEILDTGHDRTA